MCLYTNGVCQVALVVKSLPAMQETWVRSQSHEDPLEEGMVTHSSTFAWRIPWTEEPGRLQAMESQRVRLKGLNIYIYIHTHTVGPKFVRQYKSKDKNE